MAEQRPQGISALWSTIDNLAVFVGSELVALPFCFNGADAAMKQDWLHFFIAYAVGIPSAVVGFTYPLWKGRLAGAFTRVFPAIMLPLGVVLIFSYVVGPDLYKRAVMPLVALPQPHPQPITPSKVAPPAPHSLPEDIATISSLRDELAKARRLHPPSSGYKLVEPYLANIHLSSDTQNPLTLQATPLITTDRLRIFVEAKQFMYGQWLPLFSRQGIGDIPDVVRDRQVTKQLTSRNGEGAITIGTTPLPNLFRIRIVIIGPDNKEQHAYFMIDKNGGMLIAIAGDGLQGWDYKWEQDDATH